MVGCGNLNLCAELPADIEGPSLATVMEELGLKSTDESKIVPPNTQHLGGKLWGKCLQAYHQRSRGSAPGGFLEWIQ